MDGDVRRLAMLLVFQMSLLGTMESLSSDVCVISLWHWQQMCCMTVEAGVCKAAKTSMGS